MDKVWDSMDQIVEKLKKVNLFGQSRNSLPIGGGGYGSRNNGVSFSTMNVSVLLSIIWLLASVGMFGLGVWHCRNRSSHYALKCSINDCELFYNRDSALTFLRKDFSQANYVRINVKGEVVDTSKMKSKQSRSFGHSVELRFQKPLDDPRYKTEKRALFAPEDMGSGHARRVAKSLTKLIYKPTEPIDERHGFSVTTIGLLGVIFGILSTVLSLVFGQWQDTPRRLKKAS